jgi:hypothetical protein
MMAECRPVKAPEFPLRSVDDHAAGRVGEAVELTISPSASRNASSILSSVVVISARSRLGFFLESEGPLLAPSGRPLSTNCVEKLRLIAALGADSLLLGAGDSVDDGRTAGDARGTVLWLQSGARVPDNHLLREIDRFVDLSEVRAHLGPYYSDVGRPSIDPELMIRMLIVVRSVGCARRSISIWPIAGSVA